MQKLNVGLIKTEGVEYETLKEVLNIQGIIYQELADDLRSLKDIPCLIIYSKKGEYDLPTRYVKPENIIHLEEEIPFEKVCKAFSGFFEEPYLTDELFTPMINEYMDKLLERIREIYNRQNLPLIRKWYWPNFEKMCCIMTHDIDSFHKIRLLKFKRPGKSIETIAEMEKRSGIRSTFYFFTDYGKFQNKFLNVISELKENDFEIGLHGSQFSFQSKEKIMNEKKKLESYIDNNVSTIRQHILNLMVPHTWKYQEEAGFEADLSFSYNDEFGFRGGICLPYHPYNLIDKRTFELLEIPTSFMDWTVMYKKLGFEDSKNVIDILITHIEKHNGVFILNFHNENMVNKKFPQIKKLFLYVLGKLNRHDYWVTTSNDCAKWWKKRGRTNIDVWLEEDKIGGTISEVPLPVLIEHKGKVLNYMVTNKQFEIPQ